MSEPDKAPNVLMTVLDRMFVQRELQEGEYVGTDGLIYCGKCHTPVQCKVDYFGKSRILPCICKCRKEELEQEKQREAEEEWKRRIRQLKANGIQEKHLLDWRFEVAEDNRDIQIARKYVNNWKKVKADNLGLLLWGDVGTGKSFMAACIANELMESGTPVLMTNFSKILNQMGAMYSDERYQYIASFSHYPLLIIDDLGIERNTEYALEQVYAVIDERYKSGLPVIITTNLTINELRNPVDVAHARIYSRVLEMCTPVHVAGSDRRRSIGKEKQNAVKEVLEL
ncbi:MAG: ATP-binding protein [Lachnospiraceae bacterium]|nr:ATP-binding protein [Lachnospiraceae bacterium]